MHWCRERTKKGAAAAVWWHVLNYSPIAMNTSRLIRLVLTALSLACLPSCGTAFRKAWNNAPAANGVAGKWEGTWLSAVNGHTGRSLAHAELFRRHAMLRLLAVNHQKHAQHR